MRIELTTEQQMIRALPPEFAQEHVVRLALTAPATRRASRHQHTVAVRDGENYVLTGLNFFFNAAGTAELYPLSLHDALPISPRGRRRADHARRMGFRGLFLGPVREI